MQQDLIGFIYKNCTRKFSTVQQKSNESMSEDSYIGGVLKHEAGERDYTVVCAVVDRIYKSTEIDALLS